MNVGRGLFRAWIFISVIWVLAAGVGGYFVYIEPDVMRGVYAPHGLGKDGKVSWQTDHPKPFYESFRSPSADNLKVNFHPIEWSIQKQLEGDNRIVVASFPDRSRLWLYSEFNQADRDYIAKQFWEQRWLRLAAASAIVALWAIIPCIALFVIGYGLLWVGRGFRDHIQDAS